MSLLELVDNKFTDKNGGHSYLPEYEKLFGNIKDSAQNIVEIGIQRGGSIRLWHNYFSKAIIHGVDISPSIQNLGGFVGDNDVVSLPRVKCTFSTDAYTSNYCETLPLCDAIIDDGPHTFNSMKCFIEKFSKCVKVNGFLIIEDIQDINWCNMLLKYKEENFSAQIIDLRDVIKRYDDIMLVLKRMY